MAVQAARQWDSVDRPAGWIGKVYGLVVHTTGGSLPASAKDKGIYHTVRAVEYYSQSHGCHYINGWRGVTGGDLLQVANEREQANGVGVRDQRRSIDQGRFEKDLPAAVVAQWRARWPGVEHPLRLLPGTRTANSCYIHVECVPCVFHHGGRLVTEATPMRPGLRFTQAQHEAVALLACDIARRNGWPLQEKWWRTARLLGHEDLTPYNRHDKAGGWDPGGMRAAPYFDWDFVYQMIERECRVQAAPARPSWWPFSEAEDELFTASPDRDLPAESWEDAVERAGAGGRGRARGVGAGRPGGVRGGARAGGGVRGAGARRPRPGRRGRGGARGRGRAGGRVIVLRAVPGGDGSGAWAARREGAH